MALNKTILTEDGVTLTYHKIGYIHLVGNIVKCNIISYESVDTRAEDLPFRNKSFKLTTTTEEEESMGIRALCYNKLKELPEWTDAEDC